MLVTRVPGALREGHALSSKSARSLCSSAPARDLPRPRKWNATVQAGVCRSRLAGSRCGNAPLKPTQPAFPFRGRVPALRWKPHWRARIHGSQGVSARRIRLQKSANDAEVQRSTSPWQRGVWTGTQSPWRSQEVHGVAKASTTGTVVAKPRRRVGPSRMPEMASRGGGLRQMEVIPGRLSDRSFTRAVFKAALAALEGHVHARASRAPRGRRQGCQR